MAQITYTNKVALNENPEIANINKVTDDDMNEIKQVVNDNYNNTIQITDTEPTDSDNKIWIDTGEIGSAVSELPLVYPIGSIYMSVNNTNPATLFGFGVWEQIQDRFLLSAGSTYTAGDTGGEATHTLTINEMPTHNHDVRTASGTKLGYGAGVPGFGRLISDGNGFIGDNVSGQYMTGDIGGGQAHNNMPPYLVVYMWKRTA